MLPHAAHARQVVLELRELDLELSLGADGVLGEDVEDQLRAVDDARLERVLEVPLLRRVELVVDEQHLGARLLVRALQLLELALADVGARVGPRAVLDELADRLDARGPRELRAARRAPRRRRRPAASTATDEARARARRRARDRAGVRHESDYAPARAESPSALDLAARTLELVDIPSESRHEEALAELVAAAVPLELVYDDD